jgi:molybdopterin molybdotransferase
MHSLPVQTMELANAVGYALAEDVQSTVTLPPWPNAGMDGYAVLADDVRDASDSPVTLQVLGTIAAGSSLRPQVERGTCVRIMTGAPMPPGADCVVRVEDTDRGLDMVRILDSRDARNERKNVRPRGEDVNEGAVVASRGDRITPALLGVLASIGASHVHVHRAPVVVIAASGNELVDVSEIDAVREGRAIVSSSSYSLPALLRAAGADVRVLPVLPDDPELMREAYARAIDHECDLLITIGGVSAGAFDHVRAVIQSLGGRIDVHRVRVRPGGPLAAGHIGGTPWIGLPGNPVSTLVTAELFVLPAIRSLAGERRVIPQTVLVRLSETVSANAELTFYLRAELQVAHDGVLEARLTGGQGSNLLTSMSRANALLEIEGPVEHLAAGTMVPALLLDRALLVAAS